MIGSSLQNVNVINTQLIFQMKLGVQYIKTLVKLRLRRLVLHSHNGGQLKAINLTLRPLIPSCFDTNKDFPFHSAPLKRSLVREQLVRSPLLLISYFVSRKTPRQILSGPCKLLAWSMCAMGHSHTRFIPLVVLIMCALYLLRRARRAAACN